MKRHWHTKLTLAQVHCSNTIQQKYKHFERTNTTQNAKLTLRAPLRSRQSPGSLLTLCRSASS